MLCGLVVGCFGGSRPEKPPGSALWVTRESGELDAAAQSRLAGLGLREVYLEAAELDWNGGLRLRRIERPALPRRTPTTLVISGLWLPGDRPPDGLATRLLSELTALRTEAEQSGLVVIGFHFEVEPGDSAASLGRSLGRLRTLLGKSYFVSARLGRKALGGADAQAIADGVDYVVSMIYGQRPGEAEDPSAWDLEAVEERFRLLEALKRPYFTGVITLGTASWRGRGGEAKGVTTALSLGELVRARNLELKPGFSLQGIDRQVWEFVARGAARVGEWNLTPGDSIRIVRTATPFLEEFRRRLGAWESPHRRGEVFFRLRREERAAVTLRRQHRRCARAGCRRAGARARGRQGLHLRTALAGEVEAGEPQPGKHRPGVLRQQLRAASGGRRDHRRRWSPGSSSASSFWWTARRAPCGPFARRTRCGSICHCWRSTVRWRVAPSSSSSTQRTPVLTISANFLLADGQTLAIEPREWQFEKP